MKYMANFIFLKETCENLILLYLFVFKGFISF